MATTPEDIRKLAKDAGVQFIDLRPDPTANPYLAFAAILMAGLDGVQHKIEPGEPIDRDLYELTGEEAAQITSTPGALGEVLDALAAAHAFLLRSVFTQDVIDTWLGYKRELAPVNLRPVPYEFLLYFDA